MCYFAISVLFICSLLCRQDFTFAEHNDILNVNEGHGMLLSRQYRQTSMGNQLSNSREPDTCRTHTGETGYCRPIIYCRTPDLTKDVWRLLTQLCVINQNEVGVCCTQSMLNQLVPTFIDHKSSKVVKMQERGCGTVTKEITELVDGVPTTKSHEFPWLGALLRVGWPHVWCGSSLVTERHVVTAGHCVHQLPLTEMYVRLGEYNTHVINETRARDFQITNAVVHVDFDPFTYENDIAILKLDRSAFFNTYIWPACMPPVGEEWAGKMAIVAGWGSQAFGGKHSNLLLEVALPVWNLEDCRNAMVERIPDNVLCAGYPEGGQDSCQGDSGGPLLYELPNSRWVVIGIVSWGIRCGEAQHPGVYTRVDRYLEWIIQNSFV